MTWFNSIGDSHLVDQLVEKYRALLVPKEGRRRDRALREVQRQRNEKLAAIELLRAEAAALYVIERALEIGTSLPTPTLDLCSVSSQ